jgi:hypothetical protein
MKPLTRYISLLLVCGLMLPLHQNDTYIIGKHDNVHTHLSKPVHINQTSDCKPQKEGFSFFKNVIVNILPALKNLR